MFNWLFYLSFRRHSFRHRFDWKRGSRTVDVGQLVEQWLPTPEVCGSIPHQGIIEHLSTNYRKGKIEGKNVKPTWPSWPRTVVQLLELHSGTSGNENVKTTFARWKRWTPIPPSWHPYQIVSENCAFCFRLLLTEWQFGRSGNSHVCRLWGDIFRLSILTNFSITRIGEIIKGYFKFSKESRPKIIQACFLF